MSEVKRYKGNLYYQGFGPVKTMADVVMASDFDAAQSELAALREELAIKAEAYQGAHMMCTDLKASLTAAEQRNAELEVWERFAGYLIDKHEGDIIYEEQLQQWLSDMLNKPTESGASDEQ